MARNGHRGQITSAKWVWSLMFLTLGFSPRAWAECLSLKSGPLVYDVRACGQVQPDTLFDLRKEKYRWIGDLDPQGRKQVMDSYRGLYLKGVVIKSQIEQKGLVKESGVLASENVPVYIAPGGIKCDALLGKRISAQLTERCCDGNGDVPCLLNTSYTLRDVKVIGASGSAAGDIVRQKAHMSKDFQAGEKFFRAKEWKSAAAAFERARANGELGITGHYQLGFAYRMLDRCSAAINPLKYVHDQKEKGDVWADEEASARAAAFLLARCYAKMNKPGAAVLIMNAYLLEPDKYAQELTDSLNHKDFGWIHTSREYRDYEKEARKKVAALKSKP